MKKTFLLFVFAVTASVMLAQKSEIYSLMSHNMIEYRFNIENFMRQRNGDFVYCTFVGLNSGSPYQPPINVGNIFYKVSPTTLAIIDSLFVEDPSAPYYLFAPNPSGEGNIRANFEYHEDCDSTFLRISHFPDDDLHVNPDEDIVSPACEGYVFGNYDSHFVDCRGDLILKYCKIRSDGGYDEHIARFGADGTLKHEALLYENQVVVIPKLRVFKESPLQYYQWSSYNDDNLVFFVIDSLFHKNPIIINKILSEEVIDPITGTSVYEDLEFNSDTEVIPIGGDDILVAARYSNDTTGHYMGEHGAAVAKYDLRTMQLKDYIVFNDYAGYYRRAQCVGIKMMTDGSVYFIYKEEGYPEESIMIVKMDTDLHVDWKRFCKTENNVISMLEHPIVFKDEQMEEKGISWIGQCYNSNFDHYGLLCFLLNHDGPVGVDESGIVVRPYGFYPNPAKDQLHMEFSPDVQPTKVELYDLQGRLVHTQSKTFESVDMSQLPTGTYTMRVTMEDGTAYSDKVVKE